MRYSADYAVVDIDTDDVHIKLPVPLILARVGLAFAPDEVGRIDCPELERALPFIARLADELASVDDAILVEVVQPGEHVIVRKHGEALVIEVAGHDEQVRVQVPLAALRSAVEAHDGDSFDVSTIISALGSAQGNLVHVKTDDEDIRISIW